MKTKFRFELVKLPKSKVKFGVEFIKDKIERVLWDKSIKIAHETYLTIGLFKLVINIGLLYRKEEKK